MESGPTRTGLIWRHERSGYEGSRIDGQQRHEMVEGRVSLCRAVAGLERCLGASFRTVDGGESYITQMTIARGRSVLMGIPTNPIRQP